MQPNKTRTQIILIGGTSHSGKSTLAEVLSEELKGQCISTDSLARHPGRPWKENPDLIPAHVRKHYFSLSVEELLTDVLRHYKSLWPLIQSIIKSHLANSISGILIMEGSALLPELVNSLVSNKVVPIWLTGSDNFFRKRIYQSSQYQSAGVPEQQLIDKFIARTIQYNHQIMDSIHSLNLSSINVTQFSSLDDLLHECLKTINLPGR